MKGRIYPGDDVIIFKIRIEGTYYVYDPRLDGKQFTHFIFDLVPPERCVARMTDRIRELAPLHGLGAESPMFDEREIAQGGEPRAGILVVDEAAQAAHR